MKRYIYTKREVQIIQTKRPIPITDEEFLALYRKAFLRDKIGHIIHLENIYPEIGSRVFSDAFIAAHNNPADREDFYPHPILCPANRNTEAKIKDMVYFDRYSSPPGVQGQYRHRAICRAFGHESENRKEGEYI